MDLHLLSLLLSGTAFIAALIALARSGRREASGPRPNELSPLVGRSPVPPGGPSTPARPSQEVLAWLQSGNKLAAIKQYRLETGAGLAEAKRAVEAFERGQR